MAGLGHTAKVWGLLLKLRSPDWPVRVKAAQQLGELKDPRAVEPLVELLSGHTPTLAGGLLKGETSRKTLSPSIYGQDDCNRHPVREAAAKALGQIGDARGVSALIAAVVNESEPSVQVEVARALGLLGDPRAAESLASLLRSSYADVREASVQSLARIGSQSIPWLAGLLKYSSFEARQAAVKTLGLIDDIQVVQLLILALGDTDYQVRREAIEALANVCRSAEKPLLDVLKDGKVEVRLAAAKTLGKIRDPAAIIALTDATRDESSEVRATAWHSLKLLNWQPGLMREQISRALSAGDFSKAAGFGAAAVEPFIEAFRSGDKALRNQVGEALRRIGPDANTVLIEALLDDDREVRHFVAEQLAAFGWKPANAAERIRFAIAMGRYELAQQEGDAAFEPLASMLDNSSDWDRAQAARILGELGDSRAVEPLAALLGDAAFNVREAAANALGLLGGEAAIVALRRVLNDAHYNVRGAARGALKKLGIVEPT